MHKDVKTKIYYNAMDRGNSQPVYYLCSMNIHGTESKITDDQIFLNTQKDIQLSDT